MTDPRERMNDPKDLDAYDAWFFGYLRAMENSDLPPAVCWTLTALARRAGRDGHVPDSPAMSLNALCTTVGMSRAALATTLARAERDGWLIRVKPTKADSQKLHARTRYRVVTPDRELADLPYPACRAADPKDSGG